MIGDILFVPVAGAEPTQLKLLFDGEATELEPGTRPSSRHPWAWLLQRVFAVDKLLKAIIRGASTRGRRFVLCFFRPGLGLVGIWVRVGMGSASYSNSVKGSDGPPSLVRECLRPWICLALDVASSATASTLRRGW
jgi:hypothetical protein